MLDGLHNYLLLQRMEKFDRMSSGELYDLYLQNKLLEPRLEAGSQDLLLAVFTAARAHEALIERYKTLGGNDGDGRNAEKHTG